MKLPCWAFGAVTGVLAIVLGALIEGIFIHPWSDVLQNLSIKAAIEVPVFALIFHFLMRDRRSA